MAKPIIVGLLAALSMHLAGCATLKERPKVVSLNPHRQELLKKYSTDDNWYSTYTAAVSAGKLSEAQTIRNQTLYELIWLIDERYWDFENKLNSGSALIDTGASVTSIAATSAATVLAPPGTKSVLAAVSTLVTGTDSAINTNVFQSKARTAIIAKMRSGRVAQLAVLTNGMTLGIDKYPLSKGLTDVLSYYDAGTVVAAINGITDDANQQKKDSQKNAKQMLGIQ